MAIAVARFVKTAIAILAIERFTKRATAKFDLTKKPFPPGHHFSPKSLNPPRAPPSPRFAVAPLRRRLLPMSTPPEPCAVDATGAAPNATGAAVDATFLTVTGDAPASLAVTGDAPASLATTASVATTGAILCKPPTLLSL